MASDKQKVLVGFVCGTVFAVAGLASWFAARPQSRSPLTSDPTSRCPDLQPQPTSTSWGPAEDTSSGQFLIYTCAKENSFCGGLGDRQKGLAAIFLLAIVTNRRFGIRLTTPCDVRQFYLPNLYNWIVDDKELAGKTRRAIRCIDTCALGKDLFTSDFNAQYPEDVIFITTNIDFYKAITANPRYSESLPMWARQRPLSQFFHDAWQILMKPSPLLQQRLASFLTSIGFTTRTQPLVGLHLRVGRSASMSDTEVRLNVDIIGYVWDFVADYVHNGSHVFLATDNTAVRQTSRNKFGAAHHDTQSVILHIDQQRNSGGACQAFEDALLEQLILAHCDVTVLSRRSGFSRRAAMMHWPVSSFEFHDGQIVRLDEQSLSVEWFRN